MGSLNCSFKKLKNDFLTELSQCHEDSNPYMHNCTSAKKHRVEVLPYGWGFWVLRSGGGDQGGRGEGGRRGGGRDEGGGNISVVDILPLQAEQIYIQEDRSSSCPDKDTRGHLSPHSPTFLSPVSLPSLSICICVWSFQHSTGSVIVHHLFRPLLHSPH